MEYEQLLVPLSREDDINLKLKKLHQDYTFRIAGVKRKSVDECNNKKSTIYNNESNLPEEEINEENSTNKRTSQQNDSRGKCLFNEQQSIIRNGNSEEPKRAATKKRSPIEAANAFECENFGQSIYARAQCLKDPSRNRRDN